MPEPAKDAQGEQSDQTAATPQSADKPETISKSEGQLTDAKSVMDLLDIPEELQSQVAPKQGADEPVIEDPATRKATQDSKPAEVKAEDEKQPAEAEKEEQEEEEPEEDEEKQEEAKPEVPKGVQKLQKRVGRLTRQKSELEENLDKASGQITELREKLQRFEKQAPVGTVPQVGPWMPDKATADDYSDLAQKKTVAKARLQWCSKHKDGVTIVENGAEKFIEPDEIAAWKQDANETLSEVNPQIAIIEREAKQTFKMQRANFDKAASDFWPELSDTKSQEHQLAAAILDEFPHIKASPQAHYAVGLVIEGMKSLQTRLAAKNGNPTPKKHKDIDERVFTTPRVPIAPHSAGPPIREASSSHQKRIEEAKNRLMEDPDGSAENLAKLFAAREAAVERPTARTTVRS